MSSNLFSSLFSSAWSVFLIVLFFGGSIFVHELGHFLAARRRGLKVSRFSIGFGPAIWKWTGKDGVEYRLSWIPLGGYVALPQLADMSAIEGEAEPAEPLPPISYATRMIVLVAGAFFNVLFALFLACILWVVGQPIVEEDQTTRIAFVRPTIELADGKSAPGPAHVAGLKSGDTVLAVDGKTVHTFTDIGQLVALGHGRTAEGKRSVDIQYQRDGATRLAQVIPELVSAEGFRDIGVEPAAKVTVVGVLAGTPAETAGLKFRDIITHLDGQPVEYVSFIADYLRTQDGKPVTVSYLRDGKPAEVVIAPAKVVDPQTKAESYRFGLQLGGAFTTKVIRTPPLEQVWDKVVWTWRNLRSVISPTSDVGISKLSGPIGIASRVNQFAKLDFRLVLWFVIFVNVNLAIFNLLPIPVLDGGHMFFATLAKIRGKDLPFNVVATIQSVFMVLLLTMIVYVSVFDVRRLRRDSRAEAQAREAAEAAKKAAEPAAAPAGK
jgi:regulator of sigma E protease